MNKKKICMYDNPIGMTREYWVDGKLEASVDSRYLRGVINLPNNVPAILFREEWQDGKIIGDKEAMVEQGGEE